jgi:transposase
MLGPPKRRALDRPIAVSLEDLVPPDNFYRFLDAKLDLSFVRSWVQDLYAEAGRPSIDPVVFFRLQLILFFEGLRSERQLMRTVALHLAHRWYLGYDLADPLPHHSSLTRIRLRLGLPIFQRFFERVVELCQQAGLVWGKQLFFDATQVQANADMDSLVPRWYQRAKPHLDDLFKNGEGGTAPAPTEPAAPAAPDHSQANPTPLPQKADRAAVEQLAMENQSHWKLLDELRRDPEQPPSQGYQRISDFQVSTTDPDATPMRLKGGGTRLGYHDHYVVDGGTARIILAAFVTPADVMENTPMLDLLWRVRFRYRLQPRQAVGDTTYGTSENIRSLEEAGIRAYVPLPDNEHRTPYYGASHFEYDAQRDEYRCPQEQPLRRKKAQFTVGVVVYQAEAATCNACPVKAACTASAQGRQVRRPFDAVYLDRVRASHETAAYQRAMRKRSVWVEPLFGEAKQWHGLRQFRLRRLWRVNCEALRVAVGQNLKRWVIQSGWGRRHGPAGSLALSCGAPRTASPIGTL